MSSHEVRAQDGNLLKNCAIWETTNVVSLANPSSLQLTRLAVLRPIEHYRNVVSSCIYRVSCRSHRLEARHQSKQLVGGAEHDPNGT